MRESENDKIRKRRNNRKRIKKKIKSPINFKDI